MSTGADAETIAWARDTIEAIAREQPTLLAALTDSIRDENARDTARDLVRRALENTLARLVDHGRLVEAETLARRALVHDPISMELRRALATALLAQERRAETVELGRSWLAERSDAPLAMTVAIALALLDRPTESIDLLDVHAKSLRGDIETTETISEVLAAWVRSGRLDEGLAQLDPWLGREPHFTQWLRLIAPIAAEISRYFVRVGDFPRAVEYLAEATRLGLRRSQILADPELRLMRGFRNFEELLEIWARVPEEEPDDDPEEN